MSAKNCLVVVYPQSAEPYVVRCPKEGYFSKKEAQRQATAHKRQSPGIIKAEVVEVVIEVNG